MRTYTKAEITSLEMLEEDFRTRAENCRIYKSMHHTEGNEQAEIMSDGLGKAFEQTADYVKHFRENHPPAADPWRTDEPPKDRPFLAAWKSFDDCCLAYWHAVESCWHEVGKFTSMLKPDFWAEYNSPNKAEKENSGGTQNTSME